MHGTKMAGSLKYRVEFEVTGSDPFPFDMLRYDECFPAKESDAVRVMGYHSYERKRRTVALVHHSETRDWFPTFGRWESFGWKAHLPGQGPNGVKEETR